jgi:cyclophilin family peptidyl-prolyl cis-trans isomerase
MRILILAGTALLLVGGGFWLAQEPPVQAGTIAAAPAAAAAPVEAPAESPAESAEDSDLAEADLYVPEGYTLRPQAEEQQQSFEAPEQVLTPGTDYAAVIETNRGRMVADLYETRTSQTVNNFVFLAQNRFYDGVVFHRVLDDFMAQTGDPSGTGRGGPGYEFEDEIVEGLSHDQPGVLSMANAGPGTNGSQFFITLTATSWLDGAHTIFGEVTEGLEVLDALSRIDPQQPNAFVPIDGTLASLSAQGIELSGEPESTLEAYLTERLGVVPQIGESFSLDGYNAAIGQDRQTGETVAGFWSPPDLIERLYIIERPQD